MTTEKKQEVQIVEQYTEAPVTRGTITILEFDSKEVTSRAFKSLFTWLGAAVVCIFVPIAHFVLVPLCFFTAIFKFRSTQSTRTLSNGGSGTCPKCNQEFSINRALVKFPMLDNCNHCRAVVVISQS